MRVGADREEPAVVGGLIEIGLQFRQQRQGRQRKPALRLKVPGIQRAGRLHPVDGHGLVLGGGHVMPAFYRQRVGADGAGGGYGQFMRGIESRTDAMEAQAVFGGFLLGPIAAQQRGDGAVGILGLDVCLAHCFSGTGDNNYLYVEQPITAPIHCRGRRAAIRPRGRAWRERAIAVKPGHPEAGIARGYASVRAQ
ncbi:hypothetical protein G6F65_020567 [Rhizopus arrhizus]|nr:hypothetical protein G6F65_020567 [Rhizopus arrhizus]